MDVQKLKTLLKNNNQPDFRLGQVLKAIFRDGIFLWDEISTIPKDLREILKKEIRIFSFDVEKILESKESGSVKALLKLSDGNLIESVLMSPKPGLWSICISSQVGCQMGCTFCATGDGGLKRNLTAEEITDQILFWQKYLQKSHVGNIVYMGMGEPFLNWSEVGKSLSDLINPEIFGFGSRGISVSTSGIPEGIRRISEEFPQVNLAISLHFSIDEKRSKFMPVNRKYNLDELKKAIQDYFKKTNRKIFIEYIMLDGINDGIEDAKELAKYVHSIGSGHLLHVNLIRYNITDSKFKPSSKDTIQSFKEFLIKNHVGVTVRKSLGEDINGACGQLAGE